MTWAGFCVLFCRFHMEKSSLRSMAKNSQRRAENYSPLLAALLSGSSYSILPVFRSGDPVAASSSKYNWHHFICVIGHFAFWYHTVSGVVKFLSYKLHVGKTINIIQTKKRIIALTILTHMKKRPIDSLCRKVTGLWASSGLSCPSFAALYVLRRFCVS